MPLESQTPPFCLASSVLYQPSPRDRRLRSSPWNETSPWSFLLYGTEILIYSHAPNRFFSFPPRDSSSPYLCSVYYTVDLQTPSPVSPVYTVGETLMERDFGKIETSIRYGRILRYLRAPPSPTSHSRRSLDSLR